MKKSAIIILIVISTVALCLAFVPSVSSQIEDAQVLSYSYYMHPYYDDVLVIVGEAQNTGSNVLNYLIVTGTFYAPDGTVFMENSVKTLTTQILPQQKSPFYITFSPSNIVVGTNWTSQEVTNCTITATAAYITTSRQYQDLTITSHSASTDNYGYYYVSGTLKNTGTQTTNTTWVVATFYNSTGDVVSIGYSEILSHALAPSATADFTIYTADYTASNNIADYSLLIQSSITSSTNPTPTPTPTTNPSTSPTPTPSNTATPTPTPSGGGTTIPEIYIYAAAIAAVVAVVIVAIAFMLIKRGKRDTTAPQTTGTETQPPQA